MWSSSNPYLSFFGGMIQDGIGFLKWAALAVSVFFIAKEWFKHQQGDDQERREATKLIKWTIYGGIIGFFILWYIQSKFAELSNLKAASYEIFKSML